MRHLDCLCPENPVAASYGARSNAANLQLDNVVAEEADEPPNRAYETRPFVRPVHPLGKRNVQNETLNLARKYFECRPARRFLLETVVFAFRCLNQLEVRN